VVLVVVYALADSVGSGYVGPEDMTSVSSMKNMWSLHWVWRLVVRLWGMVFVVPLGSLNGVGFLERVHGEVQELPFRSKEKVKIRIVGRVVLCWCE